MLLKPPLQLQGDIGPLGRVEMRCNLVPDDIAIFDFDEVGGVFPVQNMLFEIFFNLRIELNI